MRTPWMMPPALCLAAAICYGGEAGGESRFVSRPDDPQAVYLTREEFGARGDGASDDTAALQQAVDTLQKTRGNGIVFVPAGRYRLTRTVDLWKGVRLIGYGRTRPVLLLAADAPAFRDGTCKYLIHFRDARRPAGAKQADARNTTFASGILNVNIEIEKPNPAAAAVRYNVAQLCTLKHMDFHLGDAKAGVAQIGNEIVACRFFGGRHAVTTGRTSAGWQALLMDCTFAGQSEAAIETSSAGLTVIGCRFRDAPCGIVVPSGRIERLYVRDSRFERIPSAAILADRTEKPSNQINLDSVTCAAVPHLLRFRDGEAGVDAAGELYAVRRLSHGLHVEGAFSRAARTWHGTSSDCRKLEALPAMPESDIPPLPPQDRWVSVVACGAKGDGRTDDTQAFRRAVASGPAVYVPSGRYLLSDTIELRPNTALIGLHPRAAMLTVKAQTPGFADPNTPKPLIVAPTGGGNIICGLGFAPGRNPGAIVVKWSAGERSCVDDVFFMYGGGPSGEGLCYGLWVAGGGGVFKNIWAPNGHARNGLYVSETTTEGKVILVSVEHHTTTEVKLDRVRNWAFHALQTETEGGLGETCTAVEMTGCQDITFSNLFLYRTSRTKRPHPHGVRLTGCRDIAFRGVHNFSLSRFPYTNTLFDADANTGVPQREAACVTVRPPASAGAAGGE